MRTENKRKTMVQKKENGVLSVPSELLLTAGIPLDCDTDGLQTLSEGVR